MRPENVIARTEEVVTTPRIREHLVVVATAKAATHNGNSADGRPCVFPHAHGGYGFTSGVGLRSLPTHLRASAAQCRDRVSVAGSRTPSRSVRNPIDNTVRAASVSPTMGT